MSEDIYTRSEIVEICQKRRWSDTMVRQFLNLHGNEPTGYTVSMLDAFEYSVNGPVLGAIHPDVKHRI